MQTGMCQNQQKHYQADSGQLSKTLVISLRNLNFFLAREIHFESLRNHNWIAEQNKTCSLSQTCFAIS